MIPEKTTSRKSSSEDLSRTEADHAEDRLAEDSNRRKKSLSEFKAAHPLVGYSDEQLAQMGEEYAREHQGLTSDEDIRAFRLGAVIAGDMDEDEDPSSLRERYSRIEGLTEEERRSLVDEVEHKWKNPRMLYFLVTSKTSLNPPKQLTYLTWIQSALYVLSYKAWTKPLSTAPRSFTSVNSALMRRQSSTPGSPVSQTLLHTSVALLPDAASNLYIYSTLQG